RVGTGTNLVDVTYVENAANAHLKAADALAGDSSAIGRPAVGDGAGDPRTPSNVAGKAYFISQGEPVNCWQWIDEILALVGWPPVKKSLSTASAHRVGAGCEHFYRLLSLSSEPPMTRFLAAQLSTSHWFDISAARGDFGYEPRVSTAEGMRRLADWLRQTR